MLAAFAFSAAMLMLKSVVPPQNLLGSQHWTNSELQEL